MSVPERRGEASVVVGAAHYISLAMTLCGTVFFQVDGSALFVDCPGM